MLAGAATVSVRRRTKRGRLTVADWRQPCAVDERQGSAAWPYRLGGAHRRFIRRRSGWTGRKRVRGRGRFRPRRRGRERVRRGRASCGNARARWRV